MFALLDTPPDFSVLAALYIQPLAPLSMVSRMPGKFYRCQPAPTNEMLYAMLENALGWHIETAERTKLLKQLEKRYGSAESVSGVGYRSLLQYHVRFGISLQPTVTFYNDYWSQHLHGASFVGGSREHSYEAIPIMNAIAARQVQVNDLAKADKDPKRLTDFEKGQLVHLNVLRPYFPQYYVSPTAREYVVADGFYLYRVETSVETAQLLASAFEDPASPLYLGSNDGWVDVQWKTI